MKPLLLLLTAATFCAFAPARAEELPLLKLDLTGVAPGEALPTRPEAAPPLSLPSRLFTSGDNRIYVAESFSNDRATLPGPCVVLEKSRSGESCYLEYLFAEADRPREGRWKLKARFLSASTDQRGNVSITLREGREVIFYLQIGPSGKASTSHHGNAEATPLADVGTPGEPVELEVLLDFTTGEATLQANGKPLAPGPLPFFNTAAVRSLAFGIKGEAANRTIALHELTFTPQ